MCRSGAIQIRLGPGLRPSNGRVRRIRGCSGTWRYGRAGLHRRADLSGASRTYNSRDGDLSALIDSIAESVEGSVVDRTVLSGRFDVDLKWSVSTEPDAISVFTALQEQLGLKLEPSRGTLDVLVIDSVERPTPD